MEEAQSTLDEPPDSQNYRKRISERETLEEELRETTRGSIEACTAVIEGQPLNGEAKHIFQLADHLRSRVKIVMGKPTILNTTYLRGITQMLTSYGGNVPTGLTFPSELERFAKGLENLRDQSPEEVRKYRGALRVFAAHMESEERRPSKKYL